MGTYLSTPVTEKGTEEGESLHCPLTPVAWGVVDMQGWRKSMEDAHVARTDINIPKHLLQQIIMTMQQKQHQDDEKQDHNDELLVQNNNNYKNVNVKVFGVFDGHGGPEVARFCQLYLVSVLQHQPTWRDEHPYPLPIQATNRITINEMSNDYYNDSNIGRALRMCFHSLDRLIDHPSRREELVRLRAIKPQPGERREIDDADQIPPPVEFVGGPPMKIGDNSNSEEEEKDSAVATAEEEEVNVAGSSVNSSTPASPLSSSSTIAAAEDDTDKSSGNAAAAAAAAVAAESSTTSTEDKETGSSSPSSSTSGKETDTTQDEEGQEVSAPPSPSSSAAASTTTTTTSEANEPAESSSPEKNDKANDTNKEESSACITDSDDDDKNSISDSEDADGDAAAAYSSGSDEDSEQAVGVEEAAELDRDLMIDDDDDNDEHDNDNNDDDDGVIEQTPLPALPVPTTTTIIESSSPPQQTSSPSATATTAAKVSTMFQRLLSLSGTSPVVASGQFAAVLSSSMGGSSSSSSNNAVAASGSGTVILPPPPPPPLPPPPPPPAGSIRAAAAAAAASSGGTGGPCAALPTIVQNGRMICNLPEHPIHAGATAIVAVICGKTLTVANAGDSRAVLCRGGGSSGQGGGGGETACTTLALSFDHKPQQDVEMNRIHRAGGFVNHFGRVNGNLNLSRSIGDLKYKQVPGIRPADQMISAEPDIVEVQLKDDDEFIILGCDGIWDCLSNEQAVDYVRRRIHTQTPTEIGVEMLDEILSTDPRVTQGIGGDNMTVMIIDLQPHSRSYRSRGGQQHQGDGGGSNGGSQSSYCDDVSEVV